MGWGDIEFRIIIWVLDGEKRNRGELCFRFNDKCVK